MYKRITLKVGSNVLASADGTPNMPQIVHLVEQISALKKRGVEVLFVSSGAVTSGRAVVTNPKHNDTVSCRQLWASIGQVRLIQLYSDLFTQNGIVCSQVLATKEDFRDRRHFLNMKNCLEALLENGIVPIINENDVVSVTELMFTDNDELSGMIADMMNADALIILSNVAGIYNGNPKDPETKVIPVIEESCTSVSKYISTEKSNFGRGGMVTKFSIAKRVAQDGTPVHMASGFTQNILTDIIDQKPVTQTYFVPGKRKTTIKKWLSHADANIKGTLHINWGASRSLLSEKASSLLLVGVTQVEGDFKKGDVVRIVDENGKLIGLGRSEYHAETAQKRIGERNAKPIVHYDYLYLYNNEERNEHTL